MPKITDLPTRIFDGTESFPCSIGGTTYQTVIAETGTFTVSLSGCSSPVTGTASWVKIGSVVNLYLPQLLGTSNSTSAVLSGIPTAIQPLSESFVPVSCVDGNTGKLAMIQAQAQATWAVFLPDLSNWVNSAQKGIRGTTLTYKVT